MDCVVSLAVSGMLTTGSCVCADAPVHGALLSPIVISISLVVIGVAIAIGYFWAIGLPRILCRRKLSRCENLAFGPDSKSRSLQGDPELATREHELRGCIEEPVSRHECTGFHCAVLRNADITLIRAMLQAAPDLVVVRDSRERDAIQLALEHSSRTEVVAEMVVRCLKTSRGIAPDGWHSVLENNEHSKYAVAVVALVQQEAATSLQLQGAPSSSSLRHWHVLRGLRRSLRSSEHRPAAILPSHSRDSRPQPIRRSAAIAKQLMSVEQEAVAVLASALDSKQRRAIDVASPENKTILEDASLYLKRCAHMHSRPSQAPTWVYL